MAPRAWRPVPAFSHRTIPCMTSSKLCAAMTNSFDPTRCPLCDEPNNCQRCLGSPACWCSQFRFPKDLLALVPPEQRDLACVCRACVIVFENSRRSGFHPLGPGDFYFENGLLVCT